MCQLLFAMSCSCSILRWVKIFAQCLVIMSERKIVPIEGRLSRDSGEEGEHHDVLQVLKGAE